MAKPDRPKRRMLLVASIGVASVSYAAIGCGKSQPPGNLAQPMPTVSPVTGNLPAPEPMPVAVDAGPPPEPVSPTGGNLMAPAEPTTTAPPKPPKHPTGGNLMAPSHPRDPK